MLKIKKLEEDENNKLIIIGGIRSLHEVEMFKENFSDFFILSIFANETLRFERLKIRNREDDSQDYEGFHKRDVTELGFGIGDVVALSDKLIINESDMESYREKVDEFLNEIGL